MALIQRADLVEKIRDLFGVTQGSVGGQIVDEIIPVVIVEDVSGPDQVSTLHPLRAIGESSSASSVGFFSKVGLQNPLNSGVDIFLERVLMGFAASGPLEIRKGVIAASPNAGVFGWKDQRVEGNPAGIVWDENATVSLGTLVTRPRITDSGIINLQLGMTLAPGDSVHVQAQAANSALTNQTFHWIERIRRA